VRHIPRMQQSLVSEPNFKSHYSNTLYSDCLFFPTCLSGLRHSVFAGREYLWNESWTKNVNVLSVCMYMYIYICVYIHILLSLMFCNEIKAKENSAIFMIRCANSSQFRVTSRKTLRLECFAGR
jgi:hypothetical protein